MGASDTDGLDPLDTLTPQQWRAVMLEFEGRLTSVDIAKDVGIARKTLYRWRDRPDYQKALRDMVEDLRSRTLRTAGRVANSALQAIEVGVGKIAAQMEEAESMYDAAQGTRALEAVYKTTAAQTGVPEARRMEVDGSLAVKSTDELAELSDDELRQVAWAQGGADGSPDTD